MTEPFLKMVGIKKAFPGVQALKGVTFDARGGEVLAVVGANGAGKSTLMNVLGGIVQADEGQIYVDGQAVQISSPLDASHYGITFVHQEMAMLPTMSIADTMFIASFPTHSGLINYQETNERCKEALVRLGVKYDPATKIRNLSPGGQQMVEIARALLTNPRVVIFDEPTSSLTAPERSHLFRVIQALKKEGVVIIYITHLLNEVFELCDRAIVLRNGESIGGGLIKELTHDDIVGLMIGSTEIERYYSRPSHQVADTVLEIKGLRRKGVIEDIDFTLHKGEVVGLWGLLGSGRTEVARAIMGLDPVDGGEIRIRHNGTLRTTRPVETQNWIGMITEDRRGEGLLLPMSVKFNMSIANLRALTQRFLPFVKSSKEREQVQEFVDRLQIRVSSIDQRVATLSGGNQQKVIIGRWLQRKPIVYIMDEPTRGLDVGAKSEIRNLINELAQSGAALLVISSEIEEITSISDRYLVMYRGRIVSELPGTATSEELMAAASGVQSKRRGA